LEDTVRSLEAETRDLKDLLDEKDEKIYILSGTSAEVQTTQLSKQEAHKRRKPSKLEPAQSSELVSEALQVYTFDIERNQTEDEFPASKQSQKEGKTSEWIEEKVRIATSPNAAAAINLLVIETPEGPAEGDFKPLHPRGHYEEVLLVTTPALNVLKISSHILGTFGSVIFDKSPLDILHSRLSDPNSVQTFTYHIALGFFSLAFRYFPQSKTCVGILLVQDYKDVAAEVLQDLNKHQVLIGQPLLLPFLAQRAITKIVTSWLNQHREIIVDAQAQTGFHHMVTLRKSSEFVDYTELSTVISGTAANIATNEFCWQVLAENAEYMVQELEGECGRAPIIPISTSTSTATLDCAAARFMQSHASRLARNAKRMQHEAESWQKKSLILIQGIFNLIAQQDQITSIGIARDSKALAEEGKRDSTSMKAIAIVTMTYLPGTFAAVCLSFS